MAWKSALVSRTPPRVVAVKAGTRSPTLVPTGMLEAAGASCVGLGVGAGVTAAGGALTATGGGGCEAETGATAVVDAVVATGGEGAGEALAAMGVAGAGGRDASADGWDAGVGAIVPAGIGAVEQAKPTTAMAAMTSRSNGAAFIISFYGALPVTVRPEASDGLVSEGGHRDTKQVNLRGLVRECASDARALANVEIIRGCRTDLVEIGGIEPPTSCMPYTRSPS